MLIPPNYRGVMSSLFGPVDAADGISVPDVDDDKYTRGVLGVAAGSAAYPGAAVLTVEAALRTGVGMVRYRGAGRPTRLVLQRRPEAVTAEGRVQAWVVGPGYAADDLDADSAHRRDLALADAVPTVIDAGALSAVRSAVGLRVPSRMRVSSRACWSRSASRCSPILRRRRSGRRRSSTRSCC